MALSTRKKNTIIAEWKAGRFKNFSEVAKHHKIDYKTAKKLLIGISQEHAEIVEVGVMYENAQRSVKNPIEKKAIEVVVREKTKHEMMVEKIQDNILTGTLVNTKNTVKALKKRGKDMDVSEQIGHQKVLKDSNDIIKPSVTAIQVNTSTQVSVESTDALLEALKKKGLPH